MRAKVHAGGLLGIEAFPVTVEVLLGKGLPSFELVGLPERGVRESRVRVRAALESCGAALPSRPMVVNLAPGDLRKTGSSFDLAIAVGIVAASGLAPVDRLGDLLVLGELGLGGELRSIPGVLAHLRAASKRGIEKALVPAASATEAALAGGIEVFVAEHLREAVAYLRGDSTLPTAGERIGLPRGERITESVDMAEVRGQETARRALEIAAAGKHNVLFVGSPGAGKTMLARRLPTLLPRPLPAEAIEIATVRSAAGLEMPPRLELLGRPFRAPHSSASASALVGGGDPVRPGEVTLAHGGVLFLDELPEFRRDALESLRQSMEDGRISVARVSHRVTMPAAPLVVAAMNPCPCGWQGDRKRECGACPSKAERYRARVSGPLLDRFDMQVPVERIEPRDLRRVEESESSASIRERVEAARALLESEGERGLASIERRVDARALSLLDHAVERFGLSARAYGKVLRVADTIAALGGGRAIREGAVAEALHYRLFDRARAA